MDKINKIFLIFNKIQSLTTLQSASLEYEMHRLSQWWRCGGAPRKWVILSISRTKNQLFVLYMLYDSMGSFLAGCPYVVDFCQFERLYVAEFKEY